MKKNTKIAFDIALSPCVRRYRAGVVESLSLLPEIISRIPFPGPVVVSYFTAASFLVDLADVRI